MSEVNVGQASSYPDPGRKVLEIGGVEVGVFHLEKQFYAYVNSCPHMDGPACQGLLLPCTTEALTPDGESEGRVFSKTQMNVVCPWHGMEFDIKTGEHPLDRRWRLQKLGVRVQDGDIYVALPSGR
jgi:nitrite reductase/ring-hydroxylating ferredoxin subunit